MAIFESLVGDYVEQQDNDFFDYNRVTLQDLGDGEFYEGKPRLSQVQEVIYDNDGEEEIRHRCQLWLIDDDAEEYLQININLKAPGDIQKTLHYKSSAYKLIAGIMEQLQPGWSQNHNVIVKTDLSEIREFLESKESMTIAIHELEGSGFSYLSFSVKEVK